MPGDEPLVLSASHLFDRPLDALDVRGVLDDPGSYLLFAWIGAKAVGFVRAHELPQIKSSRPMMCFYEVGVAPEFRRRGIAAALVCALKTHCLSRDVEKMFVITEEGNAAALALYASTGAVRRTHDDVVFTYEFAAPPGATGAAGLRGPGPPGTSSG